MCVCVCSLCDYLITIFWLGRLFKRREETRAEHTTHLAVEIRRCCWNQGVLVLLEVLTSSMVIVEKNE